MSKKIPYGIVLLILNLTGILLFVLISLNISGSNNQESSQAAPSTKLVLYGFTISLVFSFLSSVAAILLKPALSIKISYLSKVFFIEFLGFLTIFLTACFYLVRF